MLKSIKQVPPTIGSKVVVYKHIATVKDLIREPGDRVKIILGWDGMKDSYVFLHAEGDIWHRHSNLN